MNNISPFTIILLVILTYFIIGFISLVITKIDGRLHYSEYAVPDGLVFFGWPILWIGVGCFKTTTFLIWLYKTITGTKNIFQLADSCATRIKNCAKSTSKKDGGVI